MLQISQIDISYSPSSPSVRSSRISQFGIPCNPSSPSHKAPNSAQISQFGIPYNPSSPSVSCIQRLCAFEITAQSGTHCGLVPLESIRSRDFRTPEEFRLWKKTKPEKIGRVGSNLTKQIQAFAAEKTYISEESSPKRKPAAVFAGSPGVPLNTPNVWNPERFIEAIYRYAEDCVAARKSISIAGLSIFTKVSKSKINKLAEEHEEIREAIEILLAYAEDALINTKGSAQLATFLLQSVHGHRLRSEILIGDGGDMEQDAATALLTMSKRLLAEETRTESSHLRLAQGG